MPLAGLEPARIAPLDFESSASAISPQRLIYRNIITDNRLHCQTGLQTGRREETPVFLDYRKWKLFPQNFPEPVFIQNLQGKMIQNFSLQS